MTKATVRPIAPDDAETVLQYFRDLAEYEESLDECRMTIDQLRTALFSDSPALFGHVAVVDDAVIGFALWFLNFSTWTGNHGVYIEDMYVVPELRKTGAGTAMFRAIGEICLERGYDRLQWWTLDWNEPTIAFVSGLGAEAMDEWTVYRISGEKLRALGSPA